MITLQQPLPPVLPSAESLNTALLLLAIAVDAKATPGRLQELTDQLDAVSAASDKLAAEGKAVEAKTAKLVSLEAAQAKLAEDRSALEQLQTKAAVASAALVSREAALDKRAGELGKREAELAGREQSLAARVQSYRRGLEA
jgi:hypothetical protein